MPRPTSALFYVRNFSKSTSATPESQSPTSKPSPATSPQDVSNLKVSRAWEHDRQRIKKAAEVVKMRARKGQGCNTKFQHDIRKDHGDDLEVDKPTHDEAADLGDEPTIDIRSGGWKLSDTRPEVSLTELVISKKPRKGRERDYELIPKVRAVIALDDNIPPEVDIDEPWEHIYGDDDEGAVKEPSYATIASLN